MRHNQRGNHEVSISKHSHSSRSARRRRPFGVSRRRKQLQLGFETLEDRRVMSADSPVLIGPQLSGPETVSFSTLTQDGQEYILFAELDSYQAHGATDPAEVELYAIPTDEYLERQWNLGNFGQQVGNPDFQPIFGVPGEDINVFPVWNQGYTGAGVVVQINDSGVEFTHEDLDDNIDPNVQFDALTGDNNASPELIDISFCQRAWYYGRRYCRRGSQWHRRCRCCARRPTGASSVDRCAHPNA